MHSRFLVPVFLAAAIAFACGPRSRSSAEPATTAASQQRMSTKEPLASSLDVAVAKGVTFAFHVTNNTDKHVELRFPSGQTHDITVVDSTGRELWRWGAGRMFTQSLQNKLLDSRETVTYQERWDAAEYHGHATAIARLTSPNFPVETRVDVALP